jgi:hypothetical protein
LIGLDNPFKEDFDLTFDWVTKINKFKDKMRWQSLKLAFYVTCGLASTSDACMQSKVNVYHFAIELRSKYGSLKDFQPETPHRRVIEQTGKMTEEDREKIRKSREISTLLLGVWKLKGYIENGLNQYDISCDFDDKLDVQGNGIDNLSGIYTYLYGNIKCYQNQPDWEIHSWKYNPDDGLITETTLGSPSIIKYRISTISPLQMIVYRIDIPIIWIYEK